MFAQSTSELSSIPIRLWVAEYEGVKRYWIHGGKPYRQELVCKMEFYSLIRGSSVSPNRRFIVVALHAETLVIDVAARKWYNLTRSRRFPDGSYTLAIEYVRSWAPNNLYFLAADRLTSGADMTVFSVSPPRLIRRFIANGEVKSVGWYPHSKHFFYTLAPKGQERQQSNLLSQPHYLLPITGGRPRKLSRQEVSRLLTDWDYLAFRDTSFTSPNLVKYTLDRKMRVVYRDERPQSLIVERRGGERRVLSVPAVANTPIEMYSVCDIDADHQRLLVMDIYWNFYVVRIADNSWGKIGNAASFIPGDRSRKVPDIFVVEFVNTGYLFHSSGRFW
ncbi:MAG: hypothetical protein KatS3mg022_2411 [Armatimonadota bacterium]|nr:MAG: hypothetical protein KatS3mg022_2411 [Armatimonadota bacterium]